MNALLRSIPTRLSLATAVVLTAVACAGPAQTKTQPTAPTAALGYSVTFGARAADGDADAGTAQFDAPVVDSSTWAGNPAGTGSYSVTTANGVLTGGPQSAASSGSDGSTLWHEVVIGNFTAQSGVGLVLAIDDATFAAGALTIDNTHVLVSLFNVADGSEVAQVLSGTVSLRAAGAAVGSRITGSLSGAFQLLTATCTADAQCAQGEVCSNGVCATSTAPTCAIACRADADCGQDGGTCGSSGCCVGNADAGVQCSTDQDCPQGEACQANTCVPSSPPSTACNSTLPGTGSASWTLGALDSCSAFPAAAGGLASAEAFITAVDDAGDLGLVLVGSDPSQGQLVIDLKSCPAAAGTFNIGTAAGELSAQLTTSVQATPNLLLYAQLSASSGTVTFTSVGGQLTGTATLAFDGGGTAIASFNVQ